MPTPRHVALRVGCGSGEQAGSSEGLQKWAFLASVPGFILHPQARRWTFGCPSAGDADDVGFHDVVFIEISTEERLCWGLLVGEVFKLLEEEGVSLSQLEPAPLDSL